MYLSELLSPSEGLPTQVRREAHTSSFLPGTDEDVGFALDHVSFASGAIDDILQDRTLLGAEATSLQQLTERSRKSNALKIPVVAGTRVQFLANLGSVLAYDNIPEGGTEGTVVTVRSADGDGTVFNDRVMVAWDDGVFRPISPEHLRLAKSSNRRAHAMRVRVGSLGDLSSYFGPSKYSSNDLVHHATKDLWSFSQDGDGFVIQRLFNEDGNPLKV